LFAAVEKSVNELYLKANRPGGFGGGDRDSDVERKDAAALCRIKHEIDVPKNDGGAEYVPSSSDVDEARCSCRRHSSAALPANSSGNSPPPSRLRPQSPASARYAVAGAGLADSRAA
jgi:hypothetical protein